MRAREMMVRTVEWCAALAVVLVLLPLVAVTWFVARGLTVTVGLAGLLGLVLVCGMSSGVRGRVCRSIGLMAPADPRLSSHAASHSIRRS